MSNARLKEEVIEREYLKRKVDSDIQCVKSLLEDHDDINVIGIGSNMFCNMYTLDHETFGDKISDCWEMFKVKIYVLLQQRLEELLEQREMVNTEIMELKEQMLSTNNED